MSKNLTLGITTIGDLLLNDKISKIEDCGSLENLQLTIPVYQRPYKWTAKNAGQLLNDIEEAHSCNKEVYRVGTLILHHDEKNGTYNIVDGQQRTITFSLILKALGKDPASFMDQRISGSSYNLHNVINNYRSIQRRVENFHEEDKDKFADFITDRCELIVVITTDISEAFQFFDSQNARGKSLYPHDLLKAYHLREMGSVDAAETERVVRMWEDVNQKDLSVLFSDYLYRLKEWVRGNRAYELTEHNIDIFKGITSRDNHPYAQYYKGAFAYADETNHSNVPFVTGIQPLSPFQINAPIIAGKPFFEYAKHYFDVLADIRNNDKYEGYYINGVNVVDTLDLRQNRNGVGNGITRLMFNTAILLYVDRFCPSIPSKTDNEYLNHFVKYAFVWAYSMRAQYRNVGWAVAQNYVMGTGTRTDLVNSFNIYKVIVESDSPGALFSRLADLLVPLRETMVRAKTDNMDETNDDEVYKNYLHYFKEYKYWEDR